MTEHVIEPAVPSNEGEAEQTKVLKEEQAVQEEAPEGPGLLDGERPPADGDVAGIHEDAAAQDSADEATEDDVPAPQAKGPDNGAGSQGGSLTAAGQALTMHKGDAELDVTLDAAGLVQDTPQARAMGRLASNDSVLCRNHTGYIGVRKRNWGMYAAEIRDGAKRRWLGSFSQAREAGMAYDAALILQKKHRAKTNFVYSDFVTMPRPGAELAGKVRYNLIPKDIMEMYKEQFKEVMEIISAGDYNDDDGGAAAGSPGDRGRKRSHSPPAKSRMNNSGRMNNSSSTAQRNMQQFMMHNNMMNGNGMMGNGMMGGGNMMGGGMMSGGNMMGGGMMGNGMMNGMDAMFSMGAMGDMPTGMRMGRGGMMMPDGGPSNGAMQLPGDLMMLPAPANGTRMRSNGRGGGGKGGDAGAEAGIAGMDSSMFMNMPAAMGFAMQQPPYGMHMQSNGNRAAEEEEDGQGGEEEEEEEEGGGQGFGMMGNPFMQPGYPMMGMPPSMMGMPPGMGAMSFPNQMGSMPMPYGFPGGFPGMYAGEETEDDEGAETEEEEEAAAQQQQQGPMFMAGNMGMMGTWNGKGSMYANSPKGNGGKVQQQANGQGGQRNGNGNAGQTANKRGMAMQSSDMDAAAFMNMYNAQFMMPNMGRNQVQWQQEMFGGGMDAMCMPAAASKRAKTSNQSNVKAK